MKKQVHSMSIFLSGLVLGGILFGGTAAYAAGVIAELSTQPIYVDGEQVEMTAYSINGNNYIKLRDVGEAVGFDVSWNYEESRVDIDTTSPYFADDITTATVVTAPQTVAEMVSIKYLSSDAIKTAYQVTVDNETVSGQLSNGLAPTEANIQAMLDEINEIFPQDLSWGATYNDGDLYWYEGRTACTSYAYMVRDILFGTDCEPIGTLTDLTQVQAGDMVYLNNDALGSSHWLIVAGTGVTDSGNEYFTTVEGNAGARVFINTKRYFEATIYDFPDSVIYRYY